MRRSILVLSFVIVASAAHSQSTPAATLTASTPTFSAELGNSVAINGSTIAAGAPEAYTNGVFGYQNTGAVYVFTKAASAPWNDMTESAQLVVPNVLPGHRVGWSVAMSGDGSTIVLGAPGIDSVSGEAYVFVRPDGGWHGTMNPIAALGPGPPPRPWVLMGHVGYSVAINAKGDTIVAGALDAGSLDHKSAGKKVAGVSHQGAAYVWVKPNAGWTNANGVTPTAKLTASDGLAGDSFGWSVAISANTIVAGAPVPTANGNLGSAYLFTRPATGPWHDTNKFQSKLTVADNDYNGLLGYSVAVGNSGAWVVVGNAFGCHKSPGQVDVFVRPPSGAWPPRPVSKATLRPSDMVNGGACFGEFVAAGNNEVIVAAPLAPYDTLTNSPGGGLAYTFVAPTTGWADMSLPAGLVGTRSANLFSFSNSASGRSIAIGAPGTPESGNNRAGAVFIFSN